MGQYATIEAWVIIFVSSIPACWPAIKKCWNKLSGRWAVLSPFVSRNDTLVESKSHSSTSTTGKKKSFTSLSSDATTAYSRSKSRVSANGRRGVDDDLFEDDNEDEETLAGHPRSFSAERSRQMSIPETCITSGSESTASSDSESADPTKAGGRKNKRDSQNSSSTSDSKKKKGHKTRGRPRRNSRKWNTAFTQMSSGLGLSNLNFPQISGLGGAYGFPSDACPNPNGTPPTREEIIAMQRSQGQINVTTEFTITTQQAGSDEDLANMRRGLACGFLSATQMAQMQLQNSTGNSATVDAPLSPITSRAIESQIPPLAAHGHLNIPTVAVSDADSITTSSTGAATAPIRSPSTTSRHARSALASPTSETPPSTTSSTTKKGRSKR